MIIACKHEADGNLWGPHAHAVGPNILQTLDKVFRLLASPGCTCPSARYRPVLTRTRKLRKGNQTANESDLEAPFCHYLAPRGGGVYSAKS
jgi:hypothetical protein